ncbi:unnamed protein product [Pleuronectes platessa]|uniref:Uncharacterized protein n=1 Tax=Pleuronectes platessa TaxID=8262 RepID=A0A9N7UJQ6_PLEPL|nr:unnamed protein product [Pleuronectes platessa]
MEDLYTQRCRKKSSRIIKDPHHPNHELFSCCRLADARLSDRSELLLVNDGSRKRVELSPPVAALAPLTCHQTPAGVDSNPSSYD